MLCRFLPTLPNVNRTVDPSEPLRRLLEDYGLTQEEFARLNDMGIATANRWINGKVNVSEKKLARAISAVGADPAAYGVSTPHSAIRPLRLDEVPPAWAENQLTLVHAKLDALEQRAVTAERMLDRALRILETRP